MCNMEDAKRKITELNNHMKAIMKIIKGLTFSEKCFYLKVLKKSGVIPDSKGLYLEILTKEDIETWQQLDTSLN